MTALLLTLVSLLATVLREERTLPLREVACTVTPAAKGRQLVRVSVPLRRGILREGETLTASDGKRDYELGVRVLTWHPAKSGEPASVRRVLVTFPYTFADLQPVPFTLRSQRGRKPVSPKLPVQIACTEETLTLSYRSGPTLTATLLAPKRTAQTPLQVETLESNRHYLWQRFRWDDPEWPRIVEVRADALGGVTVIAHLQRNLAGDAYAPDVGWNLSLPTRTVQLQTENAPPRNAKESIHSFAEGKSCWLTFAEGKYALRHPMAPFRRKGNLRVQQAGEERSLARYLAYTAEGKTPMQEASWRRAEFVLAPASLAPLTPTLESPHTVTFDAALWDALYQTGEAPNLKDQPELARLLAYHHNAAAHAMAHGDDWGNVTSFNDGTPTGSVYGMNRLNHCLPLWEEGYRSGERRLLETALLWCENFYDQSIWWGKEQRGGTRYNNVSAISNKPTDPAYMWRSNSAVSFCTKGYDSFFVAYEQTGDPRMKEALDAQVEYASQHVHAGLNYTRNVGDVRDFLRLYRWTGEKRYLDQALRLFHTLRDCLSTGDLFTESGQPIVAQPPYINDDTVGPKYPYAKPYIIGYALAGLPELVRLLPEEPKLKAVVQAVADFMAESQDPLGGWRYPHPRSSYLILSQGIEHAWQLAQVGEWLGPQEAHLDAIERVLRQRLWGWKQTGRCVAGLGGWELATGKIKQANDLYTLYQRPQDRDFTRDYAEGKADVGGSAPEGIVYFPEVLTYYLRHRPASRLLAPPTAEEPLGKFLQRLPPSRP